MAIRVVIKMNDVLVTDSLYSAYKRFIEETKKLVAEGTSEQLLFSSCWVQDVVPIRLTLIVEDAHCRGWMRDGEWVEPGAESG